MPEFSTKQREKLAEEHEAMPDGSYPIRNRADLKRAIQAFGRSKNPEKTKAWIKRRARELDAEDLIPESWIEHFDDSDYLIHYGVMGMKWGVRRARKNSVDTARGRRKLGKELRKNNKKLIKEYQKSGKLTKQEKRAVEAYRKNGLIDPKVAKKSFLREAALKKGTKDFIKKHGQETYDKVVAQYDKDQARKEKIYKAIKLASDVAVLGTTVGTALNKRRS